MKRLRRGHIWPILALMLVVACSQEPELTIKDINDSHFVNLLEATLIATNLKYYPNRDAIDPNQRVDESAAPKTIGEVLQVDDEMGQAAIYIINYAEGGYLVLAADKRINPVQAISASSTFSLADEMLPLALQAWIDEERAMVTEVRNGDTTLEAVDEVLWEEENLQNTIAYIGGHVNVAICHLLAEAGVLGVIKLELRLRIVNSSLFTKAKAAAPVISAI